jgi:hypothetical protein
MKTKFFLSLSAFFMVATFLSTSYAYDMCSISVCPALTPSTCSTLCLGYDPYFGTIPMTCETWRNTFTMPLFSDTVPAVCGYDHGGPIYDYHWYTRQPYVVKREGCAGILYTVTSRQLSQGHCQSAGECEADIQDNIMNWAGQGYFVHPDIQTSGDDELNRCTLQGMGPYLHLFGL